MEQLTLNSFIELAITEAKSGEIKELLTVIQNQLFTVGSDPATLRIVSKT